MTKEDVRVLEVSEQEIYKQSEMTNHIIQNRTYDQWIMQMVIRREKWELWLTEYR